MLSTIATMQDNEQYWTPHHIRAAVTPTGVVLLHLKQNRYLGLGMTHAQALAALAVNWRDISTEAQPLPRPSEPIAGARAALIDAGLLSRVPPEVGFNATTVDLTADLISVGRQQEAAAAIRPQHLIRFIGACFWAKRMLRSRTLYSVACEVSETKRRDGRLPSNPQRTIELVCIFRKLRPFAFESRDQCLFHALALLRFLSHYGSHPTWVIGVCARPWMAHSWLQLGDCVLDSSPEEICSFTPILAI
jgi:Transglutaminase-like superfamily